jgi:hypothetical protein
MRQKSGPGKQPAEEAIKDIRRVTALRRSEVRIPSAPPSSPDKQRWFPDSRKSTPFQRLGGIKRSLRSRFPSFSPAARLKRPSVSRDKNSVSQIGGCLFRKAAGSVKRHSDIAILVRGGNKIVVDAQVVGEAVHEHKGGAGALHSPGRKSSPASGGCDVREIALGFPWRPLLSTTPSREAALLPGPNICLRGASGL